MIRKGKAVITPVEEILNVSKLWCNEMILTTSKSFMINLKLMSRVVINQPHQNHILTNSQCWDSKRKRWDALMRSGIGSGILYLFSKLKNECWLSLQVRYKMNALQQLYLMVYLAVCLNFCLAFPMWYGHPIFMGSKFKVLIYSDRLLFSDRYEFYKPKGQSQNFCKVIKIWWTLC